MTIPDLYALLERLAANAEEQKRYRDSAEIRDGMKAMETHLPKVVIEHRYGAEDPRFFQNWAKP